MLVNCVVSDDILPAHSLVGVIGGNTVQITAQCSVPVLFKARINYTTFVLNITVPFPTSDEKEKIAVKSSLRIPGNSCTRFTTAKVTQRFRKTPLLNNDLKCAYSSPIRGSLRLEPCNSILMTNSRDSVCDWLSFSLANSKQSYRQSEIFRATSSKWNFSKT